MAKDLTEGLVLDLNMETLENYGNDDSEATNIGTTLTTDQDDIEDQAREFDGTNDYIDLGENTTNSDFTNSVISASAWFKANSLDSNQRYIFGGGGASSLNNGISISFSSTESRMRGRTNDNKYILNDTSNIITTGVWYNITLIVDDTSGVELLSWYLNGVLQSTVTSAAESGTVKKNLLIGAREGPEPASYWDGLISHPHIWERGLTSTEITNIYTDGIYPQNDLVLDLNMQSLQNEAAAQSYDITATGTTLTTDKDGRLNKARSFDGTDYITTGCGSEDFSNGISFRFWLKTSDTNTYTGAAHIAGDFYSRHASNANQARWVLNNATNYDFDFTFNDGVYHLVTVTYDKSNIRMYADGKLINTHSATAAISSFTNYLGRRSSTSFWIVGDLFGNKIWNRALTADEVQMDYAETKHNYAGLFDGLVAGYDFRGNAKDFSGNGYDGTVTGATLTEDHLGIANSAYDFNGIANEINSSDTGTALSGATEFSYILFFKVDGSASSDERLMGIGSTSSSNPTITLHYDNSNNNAVGNIRGDSGTTIATLIGTTNLNDGKWHWLGLTHKDGEQKLYVDGVVEDSDTASHSTWTTNTFTIGALQLGGSTLQYFDGSITKALVFDVALTENTIQSIAALLKSGYPYPFPQDRLSGITQ